MDFFLTSILCIFFSHVMFILFLYYFTKFVCIVTIFSLFFLSNLCLKSIFFFLCYKGNNYNIYNWIILSLYGFFFLTEYMIF